MNETKKLIQQITEGIQDKKGKKIVIAELWTTRTYWCMSSCLKQGNSTIWSTYGQTPN